MKYKIILFLITPLIYSCTGTKNESVGVSDSGIDQQNENIVSVVVEHPKRRSFEGILEITGNLQAYQQVNLHAMEGGFIKQIYKDIGDYVPSGGVIATLENPVLYQHMKLAEAGLKTAEAELNKSLSNIKAAQAEYDNKNKNADRLNAIYKATPDLITVNDLDNAIAEATIALSKLDVARSDAQLFEAKKEAADANYSSLKIKVGFLTVRAPFSGYISHRYVDKGAFIQNAIENSNSNAIVDIVDVDKLRLVIEFPGSDLKYLSKGAEIEVSFPDIGSQKQTVTISRISEALNPGTKTIRVEVDIMNEDRVLNPGMYAKVSMKQKAKKSLFSVNKQAISSVKGKNYIYVIRNSKVEKLAVSFGFEDKYYIEIINDNVTEEDLVVIKGKALINQGQKVKTILKQ